MEKPLATELDQAYQLVNIAEKNNTILSVSLVRRFVNHNLLLKELLSVDLVGEIREVLVEEGAPFNWPVQSVDFYDPEKSGGGVFCDNGAHLVDLLSWWLGPLTLESYFDDSQGGVEAECELSFSTESGATGILRMSRLRHLKNRILIKGSKGSLRMGLSSGCFELRVSDHSRLLAGFAEERIGESASQSTLDLFRHQYEGLSKLIGESSHQDGQNIVLGRECLTSIDLIDRCYRQRQVLSNQVI